MGIAWLLLRRTFAVRPKRTLLFVLGYALAAAVMITLLAVGEAVLIQARDKDLLGGGDLILVPKGIDVESMKVGGISSLYYSIPQGHFLVRQMLRSARFAGEINAVSPYLFAKLLYARKDTQTSSPVPIFATGSLPDQEARVKQTSPPWKNTNEDKAWTDPPASAFYHDIDHFHLPSIAGGNMDNWAEWHYFNFETSSFYGYLSLMVAGDILNDRAKWVVSLQLNDGAYKQYKTTLPATKSELPLQEVHYRVGSTSVEFKQDHYQIDLRFNDGIPISGSIQFYPAAGLYFPPTYLARSGNFESGYVIPAIRGTYEGSLTIGARTYNFTGINGYHDHNWGLWQQTGWNWGHASSITQPAAPSISSAAGSTSSSAVSSSATAPAEDDACAPTVDCATPVPHYTMFFGEIYTGGKGKGLFVGVFDQTGFVTVFRPDRIQFSDYRQRPEGIQVPMKLRISASKNFASIDITGNATSLVASPMGNTGKYFIQYKMAYNVNLEIDGKPVTFPASGNAETFVEKP